MHCGLTVHPHTFWGSCPQQRPNIIITTENRQKVKANDRLTASQYCVSASVHGSLRSIVFRSSSCLSSLTDGSSEGRIVARLPPALVHHSVVIITLQKIRDCSYGVTFYLQSDVMKHKTQVYYNYYQAYYQPSTKSWVLQQENSAKLTKPARRLQNEM